MANDCLRGVGVGLLLVGLFGSGTAIAANPGQTASARAAAAGGIEAYEAGDYAHALKLFDSAEGLVHAPPHLLYQARSHEKLGQLVLAREIYIKLIREALPANAPTAFAEAQVSARAELPAVEARIPSVTIVVSGEGAKNAIIAIDGEELPAGLNGVPYPIDPGTHRVSAREGEHRRASSEFTIAEKEKPRVELTLVDDGAAATPVTAPPTNTPSTASSTANPTSDRSPASSGGSWMKPTGWGALAVGVVGAGLGTYFYFSGTSKQSDADTLFASCNDSGCDDEKSEIEQLQNDAVSQGNLAGVGFTVGAVGIAAGVTLLLLAPDSSKQTAVTPWFTTNSAGIAGRF